MKLKTVEVEGKTYAEVQDGKPVFLDDGGSEIAYDVPQAVSTITRLNSEAKGHREAKQAAESALKQFEGIEDPKAAIEALNTLKNLDDKKLVDAGEVEKVKAAAIKAVEEQYAPYKEQAEKLEAQLRQEKIGGSFSRSKFIAENLAVPVDMVEKTFGSQFTVEDGRIVAKDFNGNPIYSKSNPGELAEFDEAMSQLVNGYKYKDSILKGRGHNGSGSQGEGGGNGGGKTMTRAEFDQLGPQDRSAKIADGYKVTD